LSPQRGSDVAAVDGGDVGGGLQRRRLGQNRLRDILDRDVINYLPTISE
jgi:hypothetical protein